MGGGAGYTGFGGSPLGKLCIICNPAAGYGKSEKLLTAVEEFLRSHLISYDIFKTNGPRRAVALAAELCNSGYGVLVAMGGDGTLGEIVDGVLRLDSKHPPLGVIPSGTGNDFVGGSYFYSNWQEAMKTFLTPEIIYIDVIKVTDAAELPVLLSILWVWI